MQVLQLAMELPFFPGGTGGSTRQFQLLRRLVELGHRVTVSCPVRADHPDQARAAVAMRDAGIEFRPVWRPPSRVREVGAAIRRHPATVPELLTQPFVPWQFNAVWRSAAPAVLGLVDQLRPDVVCFEHDDIAAWAGALNGATPLVLTTQNVTGDLYRARAAAATGPARLALQAEARRFDRFIRGAIKRFDHVIAVSAGDAARLRELGARSVGVVPNGAEFAEPPRAEVATEPVVLFTGSMDHAPNRDAARWLADRIWPSVRAAVPGARLRVVGRGPQEELRRTVRGDGVEIVGPVESMTPYYERATVVVAPLRSGGGTRLKILDALAAGRAVVSTTIGASGLELEPGSHLLIADEPAEFARATAAALTDPELRRRLGDDGRAAAAARYDWRSLGGELERQLDRAAGAA
jgi:polysaccharide biosynthesis protein PslH